MLIDLITSKEYRYELYLCKPFSSLTGTTPTHEIIGCLTNCVTDVNIKKELKNVNELSFRLNLYWNDSLNTINEYFDLVNTGQIILLQEYIDDTLKSSEYLYIYQSELNGGDQKTKSIQCYSKIYQWSKIKVRGFQESNDLFIFTTRRIYTGTTFDPATPTQGGIMDYIIDNLLYNTWSVSYVSPSIANVYRTFDISEQSILEVMHYIESLYNCIVFFDTTNHTIQFKSYDELPSETGLIISDKNYLKSIKQNIKIDEIVTRLYVTGEEDTSINSINITGQPYIDNFSYFKNTSYMSQGLIDALDSIDDLKSANEETFQSYLSAINTKTNELTDLEVQKYDLETELQLLEDKEDAALKFIIWDDHNYDHWHGLVLAKQTEVDNKQAAINNKISEIEYYENLVSNLVNLVSYETNLTDSQLKELMQFINEESVSCSTNEPLELLDYAEQILDLKSSPPIQFDIDLVDILSCRDENYYWDKLTLGALVDLEYEDFNIYTKPRIVSYSHNINSNSISLSISNKPYFEDEVNYISALIAIARQNKTILDNERDTYKEYSNNKDNILTNTSDIDTSTNPVTMGDGSQLTRRGQYLRDLLGASGQMRILGDRILFTNNNWESLDDISVAITSDGIMCEKFFTLTNTDGSVVIDKNRISITNMDLLMASTPTNNTIYLNPDVGFQIRKNGTPVFYADSNGNLNLSGNINMTGGSINWDIINSDPDTTTALSLANTASTNASTALTNANAANAMLSDISNDNKLTAVEKQQLKKEWDIIVSEYSINVTQAGQFSISTTNYTTKYNALSSYISTNSLLSDLTTTSNITGSEFRTKFKEYYDERTNLLNNIADSVNALTNGTYTNGTFINKRQILSGTLYNNKSGITETDNTGKAYGDDGYTPLDTDIRIWAGKDYANRNTAPFRVTQSGIIYATNANISGNITSSTITGGTIQTNIADNNRIVINQNGFKSYDSSNRLHGFELDSGNFSDFNIYYQGDKRGSLSQSGGIVYLKSYGTSSTSIISESGDINITDGSFYGASGKKTVFRGTVDFSYASSIIGMNATFG